MEGKRFPGSGITEWLVAGLSLSFVVIGVAMVRDRSEFAVPTLAFFGVCASVAIVTIVRKRRFARLRPLTVEIVGGVRIRPSRVYVGVLATTLLGLGLVMLPYVPRESIILMLCIGVMLAAGAFLAVGLITGRLPVGFLQFDPGGLTIGQRRASFTVPWDAIAAVAPGELHDNAVLLLWVRDMDAVLVRPQRDRPRVVAGLRSNRNWVGADVMIMTSQYGIDLPLLLSAVERYVADPSAREGLAVPRLPPRPADLRGSSR